jgi:hypothetical protein
VTELATSARTIAKVPFLIPDEGVAVREDPTGPNGLAYADPADVQPTKANGPEKANDPTKVNGPDH